MSNESVIANMRFVRSLRFFSAYVQVPNAFSYSSVVLAGQNTTASSLTRLMCMMAENPDLQACLRKEILDARAVSPPFFSFSTFENVIMMYSQGEGWTRAKVQGTERSPFSGRRLQRGPAPLCSRDFRLETVSLTYCLPSRL